jgi:hypothetical protein
MALYQSISIIEPIAIEINHPIELFRRPNKKKAQRENQSFLKKQKKSKIKSYLSFPWRLPVQLMIHYHSQSSYQPK